MILYLTRCGDVHKVEWPDHPISPWRWRNQAWSNSIVFVSSKILTTAMTDSRNLYCCSYLLCILYVCLTLLRTPNLTQKLQDLWHFQTERLVRHIRLELFPAQLSKKTKSPPGQAKICKRLEHSTLTNPKQLSNSTYKQKKHLPKLAPKRSIHSCLINILYHQKVRIKKVPVFVGKKNKSGTKKSPSSGTSDTSSNPSWGASELSIPSFAA